MANSFTWKAPKYAPGDNIRFIDRWNRIRVGKVHNVETYYTARSLEHWHLYTIIDDLLGGRCRQYMTEEKILSVI